MRRRAWAWSIAALSPPPLTTMYLLEREDCRDCAGERRHPSVSQPFRLRQSRRPACRGLDGLKGHPQPVPPAGEELPGRGGPPSGGARTAAVGRAAEQHPCQAAAWSQGLDRDQVAIGEPNGDLVSIQERGTEE